jgi:glycosyltransferase involved in cell wall biosynthesis
MDNPLISIIVPIYKVEKYLSKCVESIVHQTYENLEIILVDDGSPDRCGGMCDEYAAKDNRIKVIHKQNGGLSDARNAAIDIAKGEYVSFVDSDDYVTLDYIESLYNNLVKYNADISVSVLCRVMEQNVMEVDKRDGYTYQLSVREALNTMFYQKLFDTQAFCKLYKLDLFDHIRYPKGLLFEDLSTTYKLFLKSKRIAYTKYHNYFYLLRSNSIEGAPFNMKKYESALTVVSSMDADSHLFPFSIRAYYCRRTSFLFHILLQIPNSLAYHKQRHHLFQMIKQYRWSVLTDTHARVKTRLACLLSFGGIRFVSFFFSMISHR